MAIDNHDIYEFQLLNHIEKNRKVTNRIIAKKLGVSVRLAHSILKQMVIKGLLHVNVVHSRRWDYFLTPKGLLQKAQLTVEFFDFSMHFYQEARKRSAQVCRDLSEKGIKDIGFMGSGNLAEIAYLGVQEWRLNLKCVFDHVDNQKRFFNLPVKPINQINNSGISSIIVCLYDKKHPMSTHYLPEDIQDSNKFYWIF